MNINNKHKRTGGWLPAGGCVVATSCDGIPPRGVRGAPVLKYTCCGAFGAAGHLLAHQATGAHLIQLLHLVCCVSQLLLSSPYLDSKVGTLGAAGVGGRQRLWCVAAGASSNRHPNLLACKHVIRKRDSSCCCWHLCSPPVA